MLHVAADCVKLWDKILWYFFKYHRRRVQDSNLWTIIHRHGLAIHSNNHSGNPPGSQLTTLYNQTRLLSTSKQALYGTIRKRMEESHSGRVQRFTKPPNSNVPRVRISPPPHFLNHKISATV